MQGWWEVLGGQEGRVMFLGSRHTMLSVLTVHSAQLGAPGAAVKVIARGLRPETALLDAASLKSHVKVDSVIKVKFSSTSLVTMTTTKFPLPVEITLQRVL